MGSSKETIDFSGYTTEEYFIQFSNPNLLDDLCKHYRIREYGTDISNVSTNKTTFQQIRGAQTHQWSSEMVERGVGLSKIDKFNEAIKIYNEVLSVDPKFVDAIVAKGAALANLHQYSQSLLEFDKALKIHHFHPNALHYSKIIREKMKPAVEEQNIKGNNLNKGAREKLMELLLNEEKEKKKERKKEKKKEKEKKSKKKSKKEKKKSDKKRDREKDRGRSKERRDKNEDRNRTRSRTLSKSRSFSPDNNKRNEKITGRKRSRSRSRSSSPKHRRSSKK